MANDKLLKEICANGNCLIEMGFIEENDGTGDPRGVDWNIYTDKFHLWIDPWADVFLTRINPDSDHIKIVCEELWDLRGIIGFIQD